MRLLYYELYYGSVKHCKSTETTFLVLNLFGDCSSETSLSASWRLVTKIQRWLICWGWFMKGHFKSDGEMLSSLEIILVNFISHLVIYLFINLGCWCEMRSLKHTEVVLFQANGARSERLWRCCSILARAIAKIGCLMRLMARSCSQREIGPNATDIFFSLFLLNVD